MNAAGQTVCLCMIVKDEHHVLTRSLDSVRGLIDTWLIIDTGSTDGTQELVREYFQGGQPGRAALPGELIERPWVNFGHNRSESVAYAAGCADYMLLMDADEFLELEPGFAWPELTADAYDFRMHTTVINYYRIQLIRDGLPWRYEGVAHEYITCDRTHSQEHMPGLKTVRRQEGARSKDPLAYRKDVLLLEEAVMKEPLNTRHMFYLAQSYRDCHEIDSAINRYQRRVHMGGWVEEIWYSLYQIAVLQDGRTPIWPIVLEAYLNAFQFRPTRAEPLYRLGLHYQARMEHATAFLFFAQAMQIPYPVSEILFVEWEVYDYLLPMEYAVSCFYLGRHVEAVRLANKMLANQELSEDKVQKLVENRRFSLDALQPPVAEWESARIPRVVVVIIFDDATATGHVALDTCVDSLRLQNGNFDAVFINNCSANQRDAEAAVMTTAFPIKRTGGGASWAACLRLASEEIEPDDVLLCVAPQDALADRDTCHALALQFQRSGCALLYGQFRWADGKRGDAMPVASPEEFAATDWDKAKLATLAFRKSLLRKAPLDNAAAPADLIRAAGYAGTRFHDREVIVHALQAPSSPE